MESVSSVSTIMKIVQDILAAVEAARQNKSRCKKVAERVRCLNDILEAAAQDEMTAAAQDEMTTAATDAATRNRLKKVLGRALQVVRKCQRSNFLGSVVVVVAGGRSMAESLDEVERDIDRCILDLTLANSLRLETLLVRQQHSVAAASSTEDSISEKDKGKSVPDDETMMDDPDNTTVTPAFGVPVCPVPPPPSYGYYGYYPSYGYYGYYPCRSYHSYHWEYWHRPSMFSDADPNSCSIM